MIILTVKVQPIVMKVEVGMLFWKNNKIVFLEMSFFFLSFHRRRSDSSIEDGSNKMPRKILSEKDIIVNYNSGNQENKYIILNIEHLHGVIAYVKYFIYLL